MPRDIAESLRRYFTERPELGVASVYLFGSHAEGRAHRESDIDVGILLSWDRHPTRGDRLDARVHLGSELIAVLQCNEVDVVILNDVPPLLGRRIVWDGVRVFVGDSEADHAFVRDIQLQAADIAPFLERMRRIKLEALARSAPTDFWQRAEALRAATTGRPQTDSAELIRRDRDRDS